MNLIAVVGASGFIGRCLLAELVLMSGTRIKILSRSPISSLERIEGNAKIEVMQGDLHDVSALCRFLEPDCVVINLAYLWDAGELTNLAVTHNLIKACQIAGVRRLIHCSTASVIGRATEDWVNEDVECKPISEYGITKLKLERVIIDGARGYFDAAILRPTSVFGPDGAPLKKLVQDLLGGNHFLNYLKSCLFGYRRTNLVHVKNVVAALQFLMRRQEKLDGEVFIVSDDKATANNFVDVQRFLMRGLNCRNYIFREIYFPPSMIGFALRLLGRNSINPSCNFSQDKLEKLGFNSLISFEDGLADYVLWYHTQFLSHA